jgi:hypothetical protein
MAFSAMVEALNMMARNRARKKAALAAAAGVKLDGGTPTH